jgi:hypothetical protein
MISFNQFMLSEMSLPVRKAADAKDAEAFKAAVVMDFTKAEGVLKGGKIKGLKNIAKHTTPDNDHKWPWLTMEVEGSGKKIEVRLANVDADKLNTLTDYEFYVDGTRHKFETKTNDEQKRTGSITAGVSYIVYGLEQSSGLRKGKGAGAGLGKMSIEELEAELKRRRETEKA